MSTTRRAPKRKRIKRRAENEQLRTTRRDVLGILLSRAGRGVLTRDEAALLRQHVETEMTEADRAREAERGQQRAMEKQRRRVEAAEQAIRELEQRVANQADSFEVQARLIREAEQRAEQAEEQLRAHRTVEEQRRSSDPDGVHLWSPSAVQAIREARQRAEQAEQRLTRIRDMADNWVRRLPATIRTATAAEAVRLAVVGDYRPVMFAVTSTEPDAPAVDWRARAEEAETGRLAADNMLRAVCDVFGGPHLDPVVKARETLARADQAEQRADTYRAAWHSARDRARKHAAEEKRVRGWLEHWADRARAAEHRTGRYRLAWLAARRDRKADRAAMAAELPNAEAIARVGALAERWRYTGDRKDTALPELLRALHGPEVITIRDTLAEPEQPAPASPATARRKCTCDDFQPAPARP